MPRPGYKKHLINLLTLLAELRLGLGLIVEYATAAKRACAVEVP